MFKRVVLDDDEWFITTGLFSGLKVHFKPCGYTCKASSGERCHLDDIVQELRKAGTPADTDSAAFVRVLRQFAKAVMLRGDATWLDFFVHASAQQIAEAALGRRTGMMVELGDPFGMAQPSPSVS